jgi:hypothetical protein
LIERVSSGVGASASHTISIGGRQFVAAEPYGGGGVTDVRPLSGAPGPTTVVAFLAGSWIWLRLDLDSKDRLVTETIVSPGHLIERTFTYRASGSRTAPSGALTLRAPLDTTKSRRRSRDARSESRIS